MGLRPSQAIRANVEDYDFDRNVLTVHGKGGRVMLEAMKKTGLKFKPNQALRRAFGTGAANRGIEIQRVGH
jgi:integrase